MPDVLRASADGDAAARVPAARGPGGGRAREGGGAGAGACTAPRIDRAAEAWARNDVVGEMSRARRRPPARRPECARGDQGVIDCGEESTGRVADRLIDAAHAGAGGASAMS